MQYLLFVKFDSGLMHNAMHKKLEHVLESVEQLVAEEDLKIENENLPNISELKEHLSKNDDFCGYLSNGTWFHIQPQNVFEVVR
ncbi:hypothetical protein COX24_00120 [bacterium (Candidatus Gribaldobacteria) CG23_combo_of_CG06-09_8_20_14_all_37_87_8]|uniref:Uncharacterized protein n=1 Tax=bacterium (Candidatus Gribaldobacteria) CG23_combo_of_CG06-09_8_20_14_all_37_87_8 TaxID=2014278 RepID=A0A2G9ZFY0_9BACT|nr:MAG: hypothetical protein COX24_00120 [bacterium (Candidatus Gribaldobacteria) CG23_combo_of_CG06-09_8_20_14_all_37_87_8]